MCGDALLVAPIIAARAATSTSRCRPARWYDLNTRQRYAGKQVLRYTAPLDQFPVFGREGYALPLGRAVQHTGEIDVGQSARDAVGVRHADAVARRLHAGAHQHRRGRRRDVGVRAAKGVAVQVFGDPAAVEVHAP